LIELVGDPLSAINSKLSYWNLAIIVTVMILLSPILSLIWLSFGSSDGLWSHLFETVIVKYLINTLLLMLGVSMLALVFGIISAWIVTNYDFKFKNFF
jgi:iron(III) transport system permease protein